MGDSSTDVINFGFAFNKINFSDRVLRLEIIALDSTKNFVEEKYLSLFTSTGIASDCCTTDLQIKTLHISSAILAAKSGFFYKLFTNGMKESQLKADVTLRINAYEEEAFMEVLNFIYQNTLSATSSIDLLNVLMVADKFEVTCCMKHCVQMLLKLPMSLAYALVCLHLHSSLKKVVQPLIDAATQHIAAHYRDFTKSKEEEAMVLPLAAVEVVLGSDGLRVDSEDVVFNFMLKWARENYSEPEERQEILTNFMKKKLIHFPNMSNSKLKQAIDCPDLVDEQVTKLMLKSLLSKDEVEETNELGFPRRVYNHRIVKVMQLKFVRPRCVVYFELKKEECGDLFPNKGVYSQDIFVGGRSFILNAQCSERKKNNSYHFGLFLGMREGQEPCRVDVDFAAMSKSTHEFERMFKWINCSLVEGIEKAKGVLNLFAVNWTEFMSDDFEFFIDGILHLRANIIVNN